VYVAEFWTDPSIALTPDSRSLVTASPTGELTWWDLESRERTNFLRIPDGRRALALSPDGATAAVGLDTGIRLIDVRTDAVREARGILTSDPIWLLFSPNGKRIVSTSRDGTATLWDAATLSPLETLQGHSRAVQQPLFSTDGKTLYTTSLDGTVIAWDLSGDRRLGRQFRFADDLGPHDWPDWHPGVFSPDGRLIAVGLWGDGIGLWDARKLEPNPRRLLGTGGEVTALAFGPDERTLVATSEAGNVSVWDVREPSLRYPTLGADTYAIGASVSPDGTTFAVAGGGLTFWEVGSGDALGTIDAEGVGDVAFSPTEPLLAFAREGTRSAEQGDVEIWNVDDRSRVTRLDSPVGAKEDYFLGWAIAFSPDGRLLASAGGGGRLVDLWDVGTGKLVRELDPSVGTAVLALDFSPDGRTLAVSGGDSFASLWDVASGTQIGPRFGAGGRGAMIDFSPDGRRLLETHANGEGAVWDVDPESWKRRACDVANRRLTRKEWSEFLPGRPYEPACRT
jgi:WD40 repeat protein